MSDHHFWLSEAQFVRLSPLLPNKPCGVLRIYDRRVVSGIVHVIRGGLMWRDVAAVCGPPKTLCNRFVHWSRIWVINRIFAILAGKSSATDTVMIDVTHLKAHRTAASQRKKRGFRLEIDPPDRFLLSLQSASYRTNQGQPELQAARRL